MNRLEIALLITIILLGTFLRFYGLGEENLDHDESYHVSVALADNIIEGYEKSVRYFTQPIFLGAISYAWGRFGSSEFYLRSLQAIAGTLSILFIFLVSKEIFNERVGLIATFIFALSPEHIRFSQQFRGYAIVTLFVLVSFYFLIRAMKYNKGEDWFFYALFAILSANTDYFTAFFLIAVFIFFIINIDKYRHLIKKFLITELVISILVINNLFTFLTQAGTYTSYLTIKEAGLSYLWKFLIIPLNFFVFTLGHYQPYLVSGWNLNLKYIPLLIIIFGFIAYFFIKSIFPLKKSSEKFLLLLVLFVPFVIAYIISSISYFSLEPYHFLLISFPYYILIAKGISTIKHKKTFIIALISIAAISSVSIYSYHSFEKINFEEVADYIQNNEGQDEVIGIFPLHVSVPFEYYYKGNLEVYAIPYQFMPKKEYTMENLNLEPFDYAKSNTITKGMVEELFDTTLKKYHKLWFIRVYGEIKVYGEGNIIWEEIVMDYLDGNYILLNKKTFPQGYGDYIDVSLYDLGLK